MMASAIFLGRFRWDETVVLVSLGQRGFRDRIVIAVFTLGLVSKRSTAHAIRAAFKAVRRWEFWWASLRDLWLTLTVNTAAMAAGLSFHYFL